MSLLRELARMGLAAAMALCTVAAGAAEATVPMRAERVGTHSWYVQGQSGPASAENQGFMSNAGFVVTKEGVLVFDALGTPALARRLVREIRKVTARPIRRVIVSHYHADHYYGLQVFRELGAGIWAHRAGRGAIDMPGAQDRLAQRKEVLFPWVDDSFRAVPADVWLEGDREFVFGGLHFDLRHVGPAHSAEDLALFVREDGVLFAGDLVFKGRVPFVGDADSRLWLASLDRLLAFRPKVLVPGHGAASREPARDLALTRDYLRHLREQMGRAVADFVPFEEAYAKADWSAYRHLPAFEAANRPNAYNTYLLMEQEALRGGR